MNTKIIRLWHLIASRSGDYMNDSRKSTLLDVQSSLIDALALAKQSVVSISISKDVKFYVEDPSQLIGPGNIQQQTAKIWWWSGIIIAKQWYILTNKHVVQDTTAKYSVTLYDGKTYNVDKIWFDDLLDLAVLKIIDSEGISPSTLLPAAFLSLDTQVDIGQFAFAIGNSLSSYANNVTMGIIGGKNKQLTINKNNLYIWLYQTDARVNPWNSGGPLIDINGAVLGITTAIAEGEWIAFALPISKEFITSTLKSIESFWKIARPLIGIQYIDGSPTVQENKKTGLITGISINDVLADLPWSQAGLKIGDIILRINDKAINNQLPFLYQLYTYIPGDEIRLDILREGKELTLTVLLWWNAQ